MLHGPLVILHTFINSTHSVQDNVIFYNIFPFVSLSLKGNQASSTFLELTQPTEGAFIELLTMTPNLFPPRSLRAQRSSLYSWSGDYFLQPALPYAHPCYSSSVILLLCPCGTFKSCWLMEMAARACFPLVRWWEALGEDPAPGRTLQSSQAKPGEWVPLDLHSPGSKPAEDAMGWACF